MPFEPSGSLVQENAIRDPSGESEGLSARPGSAVTGTGLRSCTTVFFWRQRKYHATIKTHAPNSRTKRKVRFPCHPPFLTSLAAATLELIGTGSSKERSLTSPIHRYPLRGRVSINRGFSALSASASLSRPIALL